MFKHPIVRRLTIILVIKIMAVMMIKYSYFNAPAIPEKSTASQLTSAHILHSKAQPEE